MQLHRPLKAIFVVILAVVVLAAGAYTYLFRVQTVYSVMGIRQDKITSVDFYQFGGEVDGHYVLDTVITDKTELDNILNLFGKMRLRKQGIPSFMLQGGFTHSVTFYSGKREIAQLWYGGGTVCKHGIWTYSIVQNMSADEQALLISYFTKTLQQ